MKTTKIETVGKYTIVKLEKAGRIEWVVCRDYNSSLAEGTQWSCGVYFDSLGEAVAYAYGVEKMYHILQNVQNSFNFDKVLDKMYLPIMHDDLACNPKVYSIVKSKEEAYDKIKDFMANQRMTGELNWKELKDFDYTTVGENGFFEIQEYNSGDEIVMDEE